MEAMLKILTISCALIGVILFGYGIWIWMNSGFPISNLIPYKNTFATNPIHLSYIGAVIFFSATVHGILRHGWFKR